MKVLDNIPSISIFKWRLKKKNFDASFRKEYFVENYIT